MRGGVRFGNATEVDTGVPVCGKRGNFLGQKAKRALATFICCALFLGLLPAAANAESTADAWDGTSDTTWYNDSASEFHINTAEQLAGLAELVNGGNSFGGKTVYLDQDIDLSNKEWTSIGIGGIGSRSFSGVFDGQNHIVSNLTSRSSTTYYHGLFGIVDGGTIQNLSIIDADVYSNDTSLHMGILADWLHGGAVFHCYTSGSAENVSGNKLMGGLIGQCTSGSKIIGCGSDAAIISHYYDDGDNYSDCDTVGGLIGQWENATADSLISDCWFGGSISCEFADSGVGGILGANFDFGNNQPGVTIKNCMVATKDITGKEPGNITWIAAVVNSKITNCFWPDCPPEGVTLDQDRYPDYNGTYLAVVKLVVDWSAGTAGMDPDFDQTKCGREETDFNAIVGELNKNAYSGVTWVEGISHATFQWNKENIRADYTAVDKALAAIPDDLGLYTDETARAVEAAKGAVARDKNATQQAEADAMARAIERAVAALQYRGADYSRVDEALKKASALDKDAYTGFSAVEAAIRAVARGKNITQQAEVDAMAAAIEAAIAKLEKKPESKPTAAPTEPAGPSREECPKTGDDGMPGLWAALLLISGFGALGATVYSKKRKMSE